MAAEAEYDFAVLGSGAPAALLAGLLATSHGRRTVIVGRPPSSYRLARRLDLSVGPFTRPETWALLSRNIAEVQKLVGGLGKGLYERADSVFVAELPATIDFIGHVRHVAAGTGHAAERGPGRGFAGITLRIRDALSLVHGRIEPALEAWLATSGVRRIDSTQIALRDGEVTIADKDGLVVARHAVLADDAAIVALLPGAERTRLRLVAVSAVSLLTEPARSIGAPFVHYLDRGVVLAQRGARAGVVALAEGDIDDAAQRIGASLGSAGTLRRVGQAVYRVLRTLDGAPLVAPLRNDSATVVAGLGPCAAFLMPALARHLAGVDSPEEQAWFSAREASRPAQRAMVADGLPPVMAAVP